jgi:hypothetical protein
MHTEREVRRFYAKWSPRVLAFSCLLLGEGSETERTVGEAFQAYLSRGLELDVVQHPTLLFVFALDAAKGAAVAMPPLTTPVQRLQEAVVLLPWKERSVFALRSGMRFDDMTIGEIAEIPVREVGKIWIRACSICANYCTKIFSQGERHEGRNQEIHCSNRQQLVRASVSAAGVPGPGNNTDVRAGPGHGKNTLAHRSLGASQNRGSAWSLEESIRSLSAESEH